MHRVFLLLGSNLGNRIDNLTKARTHLLTFSKMSNVSSVYATEAWGKTDQPEFFNQVIEVVTALDPQTLLKRVLSIENEMGRKRLEKWGERIIDIDILLFDELIIESDGLTIPHPQMQFRKFTLMPLAEIACEVVHPVLQQSICQLLAACPDRLAVAKIDS